MISDLSWIVPILLDWGNIVFLVAGFPQLLATIRNRNDLKGVSPWTFMLYAVASIMFGVVNVILAAWIAFTICMLNTIIFLLIAYWSWKGSVGRRNS